MRGKATLATIFMKDTVIIYSPDISDSSRSCCRPSVEFEPWLTSLLLLAVLGVPLVERIAAIGAAAVLLLRGALRQRGRRDGRGQCRRGNEHLQNLGDLGHVHCSRVCNSVRAVTTGKWGRYCTAITARDSKGLFVVAE